MRRTLARTLHPLHCSCSRCRHHAWTYRRFSKALRIATRVCLLTAAIVAIPFIIAWTLANASGDR